MDEPDLILPKFWRKLSPRMMILGQVPQFKNLSQGTVRYFCYMNTFKIFQDGEKIEIPNGGIVLKGNLIHSEKDLKQGLDDMVQVILKSDAEGTWTCKSQDYLVFMEFNEVVDFTEEPLTEEYVTSKYKEAQLIKFKKNCAEAFRARLDRFENDPDQGKAYYENNMAHIVSRDLEILDEEEIKEGYDVLEGILALISAGVLTFIV